MSFQDPGNPYAAGATAPQNPNTENARGKMFPAGVALLSVGIIGFLGMTGYTILTIIGLMSEGEIPPDPPPGMAPGEEAGYYIGFYGFLIMMPISALLQLIVIFGGFGLMKGKWKAAVYVGSVVSILPCFSACCVLGIPFGIWAMIVMFDPGVQQVFADNR